MELLLQGKHLIGFYFCSWILNILLGAFTCKVRKIIDLVVILSNPMIREEILSFTTAIGWPSLTYFIKDTFAHTVDPVPQQKEKSKEEQT
eukprot:Gb_13663 [translate_table: standard]